MTRALAVVTTVVVASLSLFPGTGLHAQPGAILLQLRPRAGDTLRMRLDQTVEMEAGGPGSSDAERSSLIVLTRLVIERSDADGAAVVAIADSVGLTSPPRSATSGLLAWAMAIQGRRFRFHVATDGSASIGPGKGTTIGGSSVGAMIAEMPATLPRHPIAAGATWTRDMPVSLTDTSSLGGSGTLRTTFRFDSLSRSGDLAWLSVHGHLTREPPDPKPGVSVVQSSGTLTGLLLVDLRRGWITDAHTALTIHSLVIPGDRRKAPARVTMTITQWLRAM